MRHWVSHLPSYPPTAADLWGPVTSGPLCPVCGALRPCVDGQPDRQQASVVPPLSSRLRQSTDVS
jgi:hypothetical protein